MTWLRKKLGIESAEIQPFLLMLLLSFLMGGGNVFADASSSALFVAEYGAARIPWVYIIAAITMIIASYLYTQIQQRIALRPLMSASMIFLFVITAGIRFGLDVTGDRRFVFAALVWYRQIFLFMDLVFWGVAGFLFTIQQGKRLFGLISTGNFIARILGYLVIPFVVAAVGTADLLYIAAILLAVAWVIVLRVTRGVEYSGSAEKGIISAESQPQEQNRNYIYLIFGVYGLGSIIYYIIGFNFYTAAGLQFATDVDQLAVFFGLFSGVLNIVVLLVNSFATSPMLRRMGLISAMFIRAAIAAVLAIATLAMLFWQPSNVGMLFLLALAARFGDLLAYFGIYRQGTVLLYQPLARSIRGQVQSWTEGIVGAVALGLSGILLLSIGPENVILNSMMLVIVIALWLATFAGMWREYPRVLRRALHKRLLSDAELDLSEAATLSVIKSKLLSQHPNEVVYALELFERVGPPDLDLAICASLEHASPFVRQDASRRAARLQIPEAIPILRRMVRHDTDNEARTEAIFALAALSSEQAIEELTPFIASSDATMQPAMRSAILTGLLRVNTDGINTVLGEVDRLRSGSVAERIQACQIIAKSENPFVYAWLVPATRDSEVAVRRAAVEAMAEVDAPQLHDTLLSCLNDDTLQVDVVRAAAQKGSKIIPLVQSRFAKSKTLRQQVLLLRIAAQVGSTDALNWLTQFIGHKAWELRDVTVRGLYRGRYEASTPLDEQIVVQVSAEIESIAQILALQNALETRPETDLLRNSLQSLQDEISEHVFRLLALVYDRRLMSRVQDNLRLISAEKRAYALETLDVALPRAIYQKLAPFIEPIDLSTRLEQLRQYYDLPTLDQTAWLRRLLTNNTPPFTDWIQAAGVYTVRQLELTELDDALHSAAQSATPLLAQTAEWAIFDANPTPDRSILTMPIVEKVIILRSVNLFASIREATLVRVAALLDELELGTNKTLFEKGDYGDDMYIIITGRVRVHIGDETLNYLADRDVFGEMALLDPEPRVASVTTVEPTLLLRLNQEPLYELMEDQPAVARAIISVLSSHLRDRVSDLRTARSKIAELEAVPA